VFAFVLFYSLISFSSANAIISKIDLPSF